MVKHADDGIRHLAFMISVVNHDKNDVAGPAELTGISTASTWGHHRPSEMEEEKAMAFLKKKRNLWPLLGGLHG